MNKKNKIKAIIAFAIALAFIMPVTVFANDEGTLGDTIVSIDPLTQTVNKEQSFTVDVLVEPGEPIAGVQFDLYFDQTLIHADLVTEGDLFSGHDVLFRPGTIDNGAGTIVGVYGVVIDELPLPTDPGVFVTISFTSLDKFGTSTLDLDAVKVVDYWGQAVPIVVNDGNVTVDAEPIHYTLDITVEGSGTTDPIPGTYTYSEVTIVDLEAIPDIGWSFDYWEGDVADPNSATTNVTMDADKTVTAYFTEDHYILTVSTVGDGVVNVVPYKEYYLYGEEPELTAVNDSGWEFKEWSGDLSGNTTPTTIFMDGDKDVTATFTEEADTISPVTRHILDPPEPNGDNGWYTVPVKVTLIATDEGSGVASTWYRWKTPHYVWYGNKPFIVSGDGIHTVEYFSIDRAGNIEDPKNFPIKIDTTPPVTTHKFDGIMVDGWFIDDVTVTLSAKDATSGINYTMYKINDSGNWTKYNESFDITENGIYTIYYYSVDLAGHKETNRTAPLKIEKDEEPPVTEHGFSGIMGDNGWYVSDVTVTLNAEDNVAGVDYTMYKLDDDEKKYTGPFYVTEDGENHEIIYYSVDKVGNKEKDKGPFEFNIDKTPPTIKLTWDNDNKKLVADVDDKTSGIAKVEFYVNDESVGEATEYPYEWNVPNPKRGDMGQAIVCDNAGNENISPKIDAVPQSQDPDAFIGWTFIMGRISNVEETENIITAQAIRLRYIEVAPTGITVGFVKMGAVEFNSHNLLGRTLRSVGRMSMVFGIFKGGIIIEDE